MSNSVCDDSSPSSTSPRLLIEEKTENHEISPLGELLVEEGKPMLTPSEDRKSASRSTPEATPKPSTPKPFVQPTSFSEWQLLAVLQRANLVQYYDMFISQGGDDINQIMQCDEHEFLEIMSLVGMLTKPLHVRRLQRALTEFSKDQASFNLAAIQQIGPPPPTPQFPLVSSDPMSYLMPEMAGLAATLNSLTSSAASSTSQNGETTSPVTVTAAHNSVEIKLSRSPSHAVQPSVAPAGSSYRATANVCAGQQLHVDIHATTETEARTSSPLLEDATLTEEQVRRIEQAARTVYSLLTHIEPRLVQNKRRISGQILDLMAMPADQVGRLEEYRKYSAIYGRFDAKRRPDKFLSVHEVMVNEAAAQLTLLMPSLLSRRDDLFSYSRRVVSEAGLTTRKRRLTSSSPAPSPNGTKLLIVREEKKKRPVFSGVDSWAASRLQLPSS